MVVLFGFLIGCVSGFLWAVFGWLCVLWGKPHTIKKAFVLGGVSGFIGTLICPMGFLISYCVINQSHLQMGGLIAVVIVSSMVGSVVVGAVVAPLMSTASRRDAQKNIVRDQDVGGD